MLDTIFALSSGALPAGIAIIRISGERAGAALVALAGALPEPRHASLRRLRDARGDLLDEAVVLWFPGPATATGEDLAELHCHGGRAVVAAVLAELAGIAGLREAEAGEFTRRGFLNGRIDLAQAEGLGDLLAAETEWQRRIALGSAGGQLSRQVEAWRGSLLGLAAQVEAAIDFSDEGDVGEIPPALEGEIAELRWQIADVLTRPAAERVRDGIRVVFAGPPNAGKSSLFNAILQDSAAIVSAEAGTTRDLIERPVAIDGVAFVLVDTAGLRDSGAGEIEAIGIDRAQSAIAGADIVLWLGAAQDAPPASLRVASKSDLARKDAADFEVSAVTGRGVPELIAGLVARAREILPPPDAIAMNRRQRSLSSEAERALGRAGGIADPLLLAEELRVARRALDAVLGRESTEEMLDALFGKFCVGK